MVEPIGVLTVIGLGLTAFIIIARWYTNLDRKIQKAQDDEDKNIDAANNADDIIRESGRLRDK